MSQKIIARLSATEPYRTNFELIFDANESCRCALSDAYSKISLPAIFLPPRRNPNRMFLFRFCSIRFVPKLALPFFPKFVPPKNVTFPFSKYKPPFSCQNPPNPYAINPEPPVFNQNRSHFAPGVLLVLLFEDKISKKVK